MRSELIKKISPIIEDFVDEIFKSFDDLEKIRAEIKQKETLYQDLIAQKEKELSEIRIKKAEDKADLDKRITALEDAKKDHLEKAKIYEDLTMELDAKRKEIDDAHAKAKIELMQAKDTRIQAETVKSENEKKGGDYRLKMQSLKTDFDKLEKKKQEIQAESEKLRIRENEIFKSETKLNEARKDLSDRELKFKAERKEVDRLIKRYNLEQSLKES